MNSPDRIRGQLDAWMDEKGGVAGGPGGPHDGAMQERVAKLEVKVDHIQKDVGELKADLKLTNQAIKKFGDDVNSEFKAVRETITSVKSEMHAQTWKLLGAFGGGFLVLLGILAKGFKWF